MRAFWGALAATFAFGAVAVAADVGQVVVTPLYVTCGITAQTSAPTLKLEWRKKGEGEFKEGHQFVRYDAGHMAGSLFNLEPGKEYEFRIDGGETREFKTLPEFALPTMKNTVKLSPGASLADALNSAAPGTEIVLAPGEYPGGFSFNGRKGTADAPIVVRGDIPESERAKPIEQRTLPTINASGQELALRFDDCEYIVLKDIKIANASKFGIRFTANRWMTVTDCQLCDNGQGPYTAEIILTKGAANQHHILIQHNFFADLQNGGFKYGNGDDPAVCYYGIKRDNNCGWAQVFRGNLFQDHYDGIASSGDESDAPGVGEDNPDVLAQHPNHDIDIYENRIIRQRDDDIETDGICVNQRIFKNFLSGGQNAFSIAPALPGPFWVIRNVMEGYNESGVKYNTKEGRGIIRNFYFYHNTFIAGDNLYKAINTLWTGTPSKNIVYRNNLMKGTGDFFNYQGLAHKPDMDYDLWFTPKAESEAAKAKQMFSGGGVTWEEHGVFADPMLNEKYRPAETGAGIDKGIHLPGIDDDYKGSAPDCGAVEVK